MKTMQFIFFAILGLIGLSIALLQPHEGMVDTDTLRDVGVVYTQPNFKGTNKFIFEIKAAPECLPLNSGVVSAKICKAGVACTFFTGGGCVPGPNNYGIRIGCGDAPNIETPMGNYFTYYTCGHGGVQQSPNMTMPTIPHDPSTDDISKRP